MNKAASFSETTAQPMGVDWLKENSVQQVKIKIKIKNGVNRREIKKRLLLYRDGGVEFRHPIVPM